MSRPPRLWHSRGYLPHFDSPTAIQALTFRLADSLPSDVIDGWRKELGPSDTKSDAALRRRIAKWEDTGHGSCLLANPDHATVVEEALLHFDGERYRLLDWCVMPNHVHVILAQRDGEALDRIVKSWKSYTAKIINGAVGQGGRFWARDYYDRFIRDEDHLWEARRYARENPVQAGLCENAGDWRFGSAWSGRELPGSAGLQTGTPGTAGLQTGSQGPFGPV
jgi:REP element-mobilizing transposase RayT